MSKLHDPRVPRPAHSRIGGVPACRLFAVSRGAVLRKRVGRRRSSLCDLDFYLNPIKGIIRFVPRLAYDLICHFYS
jgi:hypothetical protein